MEEEEEEDADPEEREEEEHAKPEEEEAERIYYAVVSASLSKRAFMVLAKDLARRSTDAGAYLTWLILRGWQWPTVAAAKVNAMPRTFLRDEEHMQGL